LNAEDQPALGAIVWTDLTVPDAAAIQGFYSQVVGWTASPHDMGDYHDFDMATAAGGQTVPGICHALGSNARPSG